MMCQIYRSAVKTLPNYEKMHDIVKIKSKVWYFFHDTLHDNDEKMIV